MGRPPRGLRVTENVRRTAAGTAHDSRGSERCGWVAAHQGTWSADEAPHEGESGVGDLAPTAVDDQRVAAAGHLGDLGHGLVALLPLVRGVRDRPRDGVVVFAGD